MSSAPKRKMATSMDFCPGGAEFDEDDDFDEGFLFDQNDIKDHDGRDSHETLVGLSFFKVVKLRPNFLFQINYYLITVVAKVKLR